MVETEMEKRDRRIRELEYDMDNLELFVARFEAFLIRMHDSLHNLINEDE